MENKILPIKPEEVIGAKQKFIPDKMFESVNEMIVRTWNGSKATFRQDDLIIKYLDKIGEPNNFTNRNKIFDNHLLDFEDIYREQGWYVEYDKPGYDEDYPATFTFRKTRNI